MLATLQHIIQEVSSAHDLDEALNLIVSHVRKAVGVQVCSIYLNDHEHRQHVLMATRGLNAAAVGQVRLQYGQGLVGQVGARAEPINLEDAQASPHFYFVPETGEQAFHAFLGVPIIHQRKVMGVLVVQQKEQRRFSEQDVTLMLTLAAQLAGAIAHAQVSGGIEGLNEESDEGRGTRGSVQGLPGAPGIAIGRLVAVYPPAHLHSVPDREAEDVEAEVRELMAAVQSVQEEIDSLGESLNGILPEADRALFDAYKQMLAGRSILGDVERGIREGLWAPAALRNTIDRHARIFEEMEDPYLRERAGDIRDLGRRLLVRLQQDRPVQREYPHKTILVGDEVSAMALAEVPPGRLAGVISMHGSGYSHVAILARAMGVPAVMGVGNLPLSRLDGLDAVVDGYRGGIVLRPGPAVLDEYQRLLAEEAELSEQLQALDRQPSETPDGVRIPLHVNTGLMADIVPAARSGAEGIGLYRTEFPFLVRDRFPGEDEQKDIYRQALAAFHPRPVTLRTLDVGGDKPLSYFPIQEDNPFLGWRGIRITLDHPEIFLTQLRAMLRANAGLGNLRILFPMITSVNELLEAQALLGQAYAEVVEEGDRVSMPPVGLMIEVPAAVYQMHALAKRVDFFSVGTNDLAQYLLAVDRNNEQVADLYDQLHPAVLHALVQVVEGASAAGRPVSVCGEMADDPAAVLLLLGMGVDSLSMSTASLPRIKWVIRSFTRDRSRELLRQCMQLEQTPAIRALLNNALELAGLGGLIRAGR